MKREEILEKMAPCALMCHTCGAYEKGVICNSAKQLLRYMDGVGTFYEKHSPNEAEKFKQFEKELQKYATGACAGCRNEKNHGCSIKDCFILECTKEHNVDFCGECVEFPCDKTKIIFEEEVHLQWLKGNKTIKDYGMEHFWKENNEKPHYMAYVK